MLILAFGLWFPITFVALRWGSLPSGTKRAVAWALLAGAAACLVAAAFVSGGYTQDVALFIGGPNAYKVETVARSYSGLLIGLAAILLAVYAVSRWGGRLPGEGPLAQAFKLSFAVILFRGALEKLGVPLQAANMVGVIWLAAPLGVHFGLEAAAASRPGRFWLWLFSYTFGLRLAIIAIMTVATLFQLGTHFDNSGVTTYTVFGRTSEVDAGSLDQIKQLILFPQLLIWPTVTIVLGVLFGLPARIIASRRLAAGQ